jgi:hypothetical protein
MSTSWSDIDVSFIGLHLLLHENDLFLFTRKLLSVVTNIASVGILS